MKSSAIQENYKKTNGQLLLEWILRCCFCLNQKSLEVETFLGPVPQSFVKTFKIFLFVFHRQNDSVWVLNDTRVNNDRFFIFSWTIYATGRTESCRIKKEQITNQDSHTASDSQTLALITNTNTHNPAFLPWLQILFLLNLFVSFFLAPFLSVSHSLRGAAALRGMLGKGTGHICSVWGSEKRCQFGAGSHTEGDALVRVLPLGHPRSDPLSQTSHTHIRRQILPGLTHTTC